MQRLPGAHSRRPVLRARGARLVPAALLALGALACGPAPAPDAIGPWDVGRTTLSLPGGPDGRELPLDAWYPVDPEDAQGVPFSVYDLVFAGLESTVALDSPPISQAGPFPLVVFSHGSGGLRFQSFFLAEALASHGFLVVAPDHVGNTALDLLTGGSLPLDTVAELRPQDVSFMIDTILDRSADSGDFFAGAADGRRIGVTGHSFGAFTALAMASGFGPVPADPRVDAIAPIAPATAVLSDADLARIDAPTLVVGGTEDTVTPIDPNSTRAFQEVPARPRFRVDVRDAGHASFTDICAVGDALLDAGLPPAILDFLLENLSQGCAEDLIPIEEAQRLTRLYVVSFFQRFVTGDPRFRRYLTPGLVESEELPVDFFAVPGGEAPFGLFDRRNPLDPGDSMLPFRPDPEDPATDPGGIFFPRAAQR